MTASNLIDKIMDYYKVSTFTELSNLINIGQPAITKWKKNNSINAIKKKCRELGIYNEIFGDLNSTIINQGNNSRASGKDYIENNHINKKQEDIFDDITIGLIKKAIEKFGSEEEFQFQFMNFLRDK